jgi:hypothetical protein
VASSSWGSAADTVRNLDFRTAVDSRAWFEVRAQGCCSSNTVDGSGSEKTNCYFSFARYTKEAASVAVASKITAANYMASEQNWLGGNKTWSFTG